VWTAKFTGRSVPIFGIPFLADQMYKAKNLTTEEIGLHLTYTEITKKHC
jgi:hypothetical protein